MVISLMYHDVVAEGSEDESGEPTPGAARYKLPCERFRSHLDAIEAAGVRAVTLPEALGRDGGRPSVVLTFDDGGVSAYTTIAPELERRGWRGHFLVTVGRVGTPGYLGAGQARELVARGHLVGSHTFSHPTRMSYCSPAVLLWEWRESCEALAGWLGGPVTVASIPGGFYSRAVAESAAAAGIQALFTSEPTTRRRRDGGCLVLGRYAIFRETSARAAAALAAGRVLPRLGQAGSWAVKGVAKRVGGTAYLAFRERVVRRVYGHPAQP